LLGFHVNSSLPVAAMQGPCFHDSRRPVRRHDGAVLRTDSGIAG
jgi:hypothetical protein